jgi:hypothetical protein
MCSGAGRDRFHKTPKYFSERIFGRIASYLERETVCGMENGSAKTARSAYCTGMMMTHGQWQPLPKLGTHSESMFGIIVIL